MRSKPALVYVLFILISLGGGLLIGLNNIPGGWYEALNKPAFTPPSWLFGPAWTVLYILIGIAGAKIYLSEQVKQLLPIWIAQMVLNFAWSPVFFTLHQIEAALGIIIALLIAIALFIWKARNPEPIAALLFIPYLLWVTYATALNGAIVGLNKGEDFAMARFEPKVALQDLTCLHAEPTNSTPKIPWRIICLN